MSENDPQIDDAVIRGKFDAEVEPLEAIDFPVRCDVRTKDCRNPAEWISRCNACGTVGFWCTPCRQHFIETSMIVRLIYAAQVTCKICWTQSDSVDEAMTFTPLKVTS